jgi:hypothetical protein
MMADSPESTNNPPKCDATPAEDTSPSKGNAEAVTGCARSSGLLPRWIRLTILGLLAATGTVFWTVKGCEFAEHRIRKNAEPPSTIQTFQDFLRWQTEIHACSEVQVRGITYFHVIGPDACFLPSGGALYVFDAKGNFVGWSPDSGDVMRKEAIFYPKWWLPKESHSRPISLEELKRAIASQ